MFRSIRFGINEAHGRGVAIQMNYFLDNGGVVANADGTFAVNPARIKENVSGLTRDIMTIQARATMPRPRRCCEKMGVVRPPVQAVLDKLTGVPGGHRAALRHRRAADGATVMSQRTWASGVN